jgi:hypothetical protein
MNNHSRRKRSKNPDRHSATSASGASQKRGQTLLPMLVGGLVLIIVGMVAVVFVVSK